MHRFAAYALGLVLVATPLASSALSFADISDDIRFLLTRIAFIKAESEGLTLACTVTAAPSSVQVGEPFKLIWGSYGALDPAESESSELPQNGVATIIVQEAGNYEYELTFHGENGDETNCTTYLTVTAQ